MWAALYVFTVCFVALTLFAAVHEFENRPARRCAQVFHHRRCRCGNRKRKTIVALTSAG
jgi:hypothetical protein